MYTGSITHGISLTKVMAPVMWYSTCPGRNLLGDIQVVAYAPQLWGSEGIVFIFLNINENNKGKEKYVNKWKTDNTTLLT